MKSPLGRLNPAVGPHFQDRLADVIRQEKPKVMVETGLETGFGAEHYLQAMDQVGCGHLYSIDPTTHIEMVKAPLAHPRFTWIRELSQFALEPLFRKVGAFDLFLHDSDHDPECQGFEYEFAWNHVRSGGIIATDDPYWGVPPHRTWSKFLARHGVGQAIIIGNCQYFRKP